jgi:hypothetical protein
MTKLEHHFLPTSALVLAIPSLFRHLILPTLEIVINIGDYHRVV